VKRARPSKTWSTAPASSKRASVLGNDLGSALHKNFRRRHRSLQFSRKIGAATNEQSVGSSQIAKATTGSRNHPGDQLAVEEQASGAQAVVRAMDKMRELVQQSAQLHRAIRRRDRCSSSPRNLLDTMDRFVIDRATSRDTTATRRRNGVMRRPRIRRTGIRELTRS